MYLVADSAKVMVHGTATGFGCAFHAMALALDVKDTVEARAIVGPTRLNLSAEAAADPTTVGLTAEDHPTVKSVRVLLDAVGASQVGLSLQYSGRIPPASGLGSYSAKVLAGLLIARQLLGDPDVLTADHLSAMAIDLGADRLRVSALLHGPLALSVPAGEAPDTIWSADVNAPISPVGFVPSVRLGQRTREPQKPRVAYFDDAAKAAGRAATLAAALVGTAANSHSGGLLPSEGSADSGDGQAASSADSAVDTSLREQLLMGTHDDLRAEDTQARLPASAALTDWLRGLGLPAFVSGDGPAVVSLIRPRKEILEAAERSGWRIVELGGARQTDLTSP